MNAQELGEMDENEYDQVFQRINFKEFVFKIRAKMDVFNVSLSFRSGLAGSGSGVLSPRSGISINLYLICFDTAC